MQAVDAAIATGEVRRTQPRLGAVRAKGAEIDMLFRVGAMVVLHCVRAYPRGVAHSPHTCDEEAGRVVAVRHSQEELGCSWMGVGWLVVRKVIELEVGVLVQGIVLSVARSPG